MSIQGMRGIFRRLSYNAALSANVHRRDINHWFFFHYYLLFACYGTFRFSINIFFFQKKGGTKLYICNWIKIIGHSLKTVPKKCRVKRTLSGVWFSVIKYWGGDQILFSAQVLWHIIDMAVSDTYIHTYNIYPSPKLLGQSAAKFAHF